MAWTCEIESELAREVRFNGPAGRLRAELWQGKFSMEVFHGLRALQNPRARLMVRAPFRLHFGREPRILRIESEGGRGGRAVLRLVGANARWPKPLVAELRDVFEDHVEPGTRNAKLSAAGAEAIKKRKYPADASKASSKPKPAMSEATKEKIRVKTRDRLLAQGIVMKEKTKKRRKRRRKRVSRGKQLHHEGRQELPGSDPRSGEGLDPVAGQPAGQREALDVVAESVISA